MWTNLKKPPLNVLNKLNFKRDVKLQTKYMYLVTVLFDIKPFIVFSTK